jgi:hypothetical protein
LYLAYKKQNIPAAASLQQQRQLPMQLTLANDCVQRVLNPSSPATLISAQPL